MQSMIWILNLMVFHPEYCKCSSTNQTLVNICYEEYCNAGRIHEAKHLNVVLNFEEVREIYLLIKREFFHCFGFEQIPKIDWRNT